MPCSFYIIQIRSAADYKECYYPDHAEPRCDENPCDFDCKDGFEPHPKHYPTSCVCEYPHTVCNGECGEFKHCGSQKPYKRDAKWRDATCPQGWSACPLWGVSGRDYECVNVANDLWSCAYWTIYNDPLYCPSQTVVDFRCCYRWRLRNSFTSYRSYWYRLHCHPGSTRRVLLGRSLRCGSLQGRVPSQS